MRYHATPEGSIPFTAEEEALFDNSQLSNMKAAKLTEIKQERIEATNAPINGFEVASLVDRENIQGAIDYFATLSGAGDTITWTMADDTDRNVTLAELQGAKDGYVIRKAQVFAAYQEQKAALNAATTIAQVEAV